MLGTRTFCERGSNFDDFLVDEGSEGPNTTLSGPSSTRWRADDDLAGVLTCIAKRPYIFVIFQGWADPLSFPLDPRMDL